MKGLVIWSQSVCRSQMALYRELSKILGVPVDIAVWYYKSNPNEQDNRDIIGFSREEFSDMAIYPVGEDWGRGEAFLDEHVEWNHLFCNYQQSPNFRRIQKEAIRRGERTAVGGESPCNMYTGWRHFAKEIYLRTKLPWMIRTIVKGADFFLNYSGNDDRLAQVIGWTKTKIIPFGYFPPPLEGTRFRARTGSSPFEILVTGEMTWHRGSDVAIRSLVELKRMGIPYHATFTQKGPLLTSLEQVARKENLPVDFVGLLPMSDLHKAYETCSVYVGAGRCEPWGMRLNDALNCGAPLVISRGMGGVKMIDDYGCGLSFENENALDLALKLRMLATDDSLYQTCAKNVVRASVECSPERMAVRLAKILKENWK